MDEGRPIRLGLRHNAAQVTLLLAVNGLVGGMVASSRPPSPCWQHARST